MPKSNPIALLCGVPPVCDRCGENDAQIRIDLPHFGRRVVCGDCVVLLMEQGLRAGLDELPK